MKKRFAFLVGFMGVLLSPYFAHAHVKWFSNVKPVRESMENILSPFFITFALAVAVILAILTQLLPFIMNLPISKSIDAKLAGLHKYSRYILKYGTALALILQITSGTIFAPEFKIHESWQLIAFWVAIILLLVPIHYATKLASLILLFLFITVWVHIGWFHMFDYGFYLAIIFVLLIGKTKLEDWGFPFLYLGTGLSLCWVAVEKWVYPNMTIDIVKHHAIPTFGFVPTTFIVMAAFVEFVVGYLLVVGILNRLLAVVVTILFILTTMIFGGVEIVGHAMIHIILIIFIIEGVSFYHPPIAMHKTKIDQMIFVFLNFIFVLSSFILIYYRFG